MRQLSVQRWPVLSERAGNSFSLYESRFFGLGDRFWGPDFGPGISTSAIDLKLGGPKLGPVFQAQIVDYELKPGGNVLEMASVCAGSVSAWQTTTPVERGRDCCAVCPQVSAWFNLSSRVLAVTASSSVQLSKER